MPPGCHSHMMTLDILVQLTHPTNSWWAHCPNQMIEIKKKYIFYDYFYPNVKTSDTVKSQFCAFHRFTTAELSWHVACTELWSDSSIIRIKNYSRNNFNYELKLLLQCSTKALEKWGQMTNTIEKYGDIGNFSGVTYVILPFVILKFVGTWAPTAKMIGDIPDFNVLIVP